MIATAILFGVVRAAQEGPINVVDQERVFSDEEVHQMTGEIVIGNAYKNRWKRHSPKNGWNPREWRLKYNPDQPAFTLHLAYYKTKKLGFPCNEFKNCIRLQALPLCIRHNYNGCMIDGKEKQMKHDTKRGTRSVGLRFQTKDRQFYLSFENHHDREVWSNKLEREVEDILAKGCKVGDEADEKDVSLSKESQKASKSDLDRYLQIWRDNGNEKGSGVKGNPNAVELLAVLDACEISTTYIHLRQIMFDAGLETNKPIDVVRNEGYKTSRRLLRSEKYFGC